MTASAILAWAARSSRVRRAMRIALVAIALFVLTAFVGLRLNAGRRYSNLASGYNLEQLALGAFAMFICVLALGWLWCRLVEALTGHRINGGLRAFVYTWLGRYVPGTLPYHAARLMLADRLGTTKRAVAASIGYESILIIGSAAFVGVTGVLVGFGAHASDGFLYLLAGLLLCCLPVGLHPRILVPVTNRFLRLARHQPLASDSLLSPRQTALMFGGYAAVYALNGVGFYLVTLALNQHVNPILAVGAYNLAGVIGIVVLFVPSGLGVREAALVALLSGALPPEQALLAAGLARVVATVADLTAPALQLVVDLGRRLRSTRPHSGYTTPVGVLGED